MDIFDLDQADDKVIQVLVFEQRDLQPVIHHLGCPRRVWPVALTLDFASLYFARHHSDHVGLLLQYHLPEVTQSGGQRTLAGDVHVFLFLYRHLDEIGVDVAAIFAQQNSSRVNWHIKKNKKHISDEYTRNNSCNKK